MQNKSAPKAARIIRPGPEMAASIFEVAEACDLARWSISEYEQELQREYSLAAAAVHEGRLCGFIVGRVYDGEAEILNIGVLPELRRQNIGEMLMHWFMAECLKHSAVTIWLEARSSNAVALAFYNSFRFEPVVVRKNYYADPDEDAVVLRAELKSI